MTSTKDATEIRQWYDQYIAANTWKLTAKAPLIKAVQDDELDVTSLEERIESFRSNVPVTGRFCVDCQALFDNWPDLSDDSDELTAHPDGSLLFPGTGADWKHAVATSSNVIQLEAAARNGCLLCALLVQKLKDTEELHILRRIAARIESLGESAEMKISLQNWGTNQDQLLWLNWPGKVSTHCNGGSALSQKLVVGALRSDAATYHEVRDTLEIARQWLHECSQDHTECNEKHANVLPSRLLYVGEDQIRLVSTTGWQSDCRYTTLSHRWNAEDFTMLLKENISALSESISPERLPKTFADAIEINRKLGIEYLWIDSLCIVQDDEDDWQHETALMEHVYGGSYLNIAASSATSLHGGCWVATKGMQSTFRTRVKVGDLELVREIRDDGCYEEAVWNSHLATRAWALQEKLLPPRTIHLGDRGAFWECRHKIANEYLPDGFTKRLGSGLLQRMRKLEFLQGWWADVVHLYTSANLTFARDKLPALSGIARLIHSQKGGQYLAGLWRDERIEAQLCWRNEGPRERPTTWRAPSWSWASVDGPISYRTTQEGICDDSYAHVVDASVTPLDGDEFGELSAGKLNITCTNILLGDLMGRDKLIVQGVNEKFECPIFLDALDEEPLSTDTTAYILPLIGGKQGMRWRNKDEVEWREPKMIQGIVLRRTGSSAGEFRRIGAFQCEQKRMEDDAPDGDLASQRYHAFMQKLEDDGHFFARSVCAKVVENVEHPKEIFAITVI